MFRVILLLLFCIFSNILADSLKQTVSNTLIHNPSIFSKIENQKAFEKYIDDRESAYLPTLDFEGYLETSELNDDRDSSQTDGQWTRQDGYNAALVFRQYIYDGGLTPSRVSEANAIVNSNKYLNLNEIENIILESVKVYNRLVLAEEKIILTTNMIKVNEDNLITAKENEEISGEVLETYQVESKLHFATDTLYQDENLEVEALADYERYVGVKLEGRVCRPIIQETNIPENLEESIKLAVLNNFRIKEQIEKIKEQREKIAQSDANFLPQIDIELKASIDEDLILSEDGVSKNNYARLNLNWNLFNGNKDFNTSQQEMIFLNEQKKQLEEITNEIVANIKSLFSKHFLYKKRVNALKRYVDSNVNIVDIYNEQFKAGTRTFIDILNAQSELYQSTRTLLDVEFLYLNNYYDLMFAFSKLSNAVLQTSNQNCETQKPKVTEYIPEKKESSSDLEIEELLEDMGDMGTMIEDSLDNNKNENEDDNSNLIENMKEILNEPADIDINSIKEELKLNQKSNKTDIRASLGIEKLLKSDDSFYTINLATLENIEDGNDFVIENKISNKAILFEFGKEKKYTKVLYGVFKNYDEAKEEVSKLDYALAKNRPIIKKINKYQQLYKKYN